MIDLHTHSLFSDGVLIPSELVYRAKVRGYDTIGLTDHGDFSTFDFAIPRLCAVAGDLGRCYGLRVIPGVEITYVPPELIGRAVEVCRKLGAELIVVHGETPAETVPPGTNRAAILAGADILAHPGHITEEEVLLAKEHDVCLEITTRNGHNATNRHVASLAKKTGARLVLDTDTHTPENLLTSDLIRSTLTMSELTSADFEQMESNSRSIVARIARTGRTKNV